MFHVFIMLLSLPIPIYQEKQSVTDYFVVQKADSMPSDKAGS